MANVVDEARKLKSEAMDARDQGEFEQAIMLIQRARQLLSSALDELTANRQERERPGRFEVDVANQLVHIFGSEGGIYRRLKNYEASAKAYDAGYEFEKPGSVYGIVNSYNLVQRLVSRVFIKPESLEEESTQVLGLFVRQELLRAKEEIQRQLAGKRAGDEYAGADLALVSLLLGDDWEAFLDRFIYSIPPPQPYAIKVTFELIHELRQALENSTSVPIAVKARLSQAASELVGQVVG